MSEDADLLRRYVTERSEAAFTELIRRHVDLVYSAALRLVNGDVHRAKDVTQQVFAECARQAKRLSRHPALAGWLYTTTRLIALRAIRTEQRRTAREREAHTMNELLRQPDAETDWDQLRPVLEDAMHELGENDRHAVLLRFFQNKNLKEVGAALGLNENAARMRVERALGKLREHLARRGITTSVGALALAITANAVRAAPAGLTAAISMATIQGTTFAATTIVTVTKAIAMTTLQKTFVAVTVAVLAGAAIYQARQASQLRGQVQSLRQQQAPLVGQIARLQQSLADATNRLAKLLAENDRLNSNSDRTELLKLRGEVTRLRASRTAEVGESTDSLDSAARDLLAKVAELKSEFDQMPDRKIPEMQFLAPQDWFEVALQPSYSNTISVRATLNALRRKAKDKFAVMMADALSGYTQSNGGRLPSELSELKSYFGSPVDDAVLSRYELLHTGDLSQLAPGSALVGEKSGVDDKFDSLYSIGLSQYTVRNFVGSGIRGGDTSQYTIGILPRSARPK